MVEPGPRRPERPGSRDHIPTAPMTLVLAVTVACRFSPDLASASPAGMAQRPALTLRSLALVTKLPVSSASAFAFASRIGPLPWKATRIFGRFSRSDAIARLTSTEVLPSTRTSIQGSVHSALALALALHEPLHSAEPWHSALGGVSSALHFGATKS